MLDVDIITEFFGKDDNIDIKLPKEVIGIGIINPRPEAVNYPVHYGGEDNPYEAIKVIEAWGLGFATGNAIKYIARAKYKGKELEDLRKSVWYLNREIQRLENGT